MRYIIFNHKGEVLVVPGATAAEKTVLPEKELFEEISTLLPAEEEIFHFNIHGKDYIAFDIEATTAVTPRLTPVGLRESYLMLSSAEYEASAKGAELLDWNRTTRFCAKCGTLLHRAGEISKRCDTCHTEYFPQVSPCVIVLVTRGEGPDKEALLVHAANFRRPFFGLVAGFVETGEDLEEAVAREVKEETGLEIEGIRYFGSQAWPFPHQLMLGFTARWKRGEVRFADGELTAGGFFRREDIPQIPTPPSIARRMIDTWLEE